MKEVLASIAIWKQKRNEAGVDDATFDNFQRIARTHYLPADTRFEVIPRFETSSGVYSIWSVRIVMPQVSKPEWTYAFGIRHQFVAWNSRMASQIHWGMPDNGLQAGFRLIPAQNDYRVGQVVDVEFLYRSIYGPAIVSLPNAFMHQEAHLRRSETNDALEAIVDEQEKIIGGWMSHLVTEEPIARRGQKIGFTDDPKADFNTNVGTRLIVSPTDGKLSLSFTVANPADGAEGQSLETGELHFRVVRDELSQRDPQAASGIDATAMPVQVESTDGNSSQPAKRSSNSARQGTVENLTKIIYALHRYHDAHGHFPPATILGKDGQGGPPHSWRVELLPLLGYQELYDDYHFDEPWDSDHNKSLLAKMPDVYRSPLDSADSVNTSYLGVVSDDVSKRAAELQEMRDQRSGVLEPEYEQYTPEATVFWKQRGASFIDMHDGTSNCIAVIEAQRDIPWTKPADIDYSAEQPLPELGGWFEQGVHAAMADGMVKFLASDNDEQTIRNLLTITDGVPTKPLLVRRLRIHGAIAVAEGEPEAAAGPEFCQVPDGPLLRILPDQRSIITEADILEVAATTAPNNPPGGDIVAMTLTEEAGKRFLDATTALSEQGTNGYMVIMLDRKVVNAPRVHGPISSKLTITGKIDAMKLAEQIQAAMDEVKSVDLAPAMNGGDDELASIDEVSPTTDVRQGNAALTESGSFVKVPLMVEWHPESAMKKHLGKRHLTMLADGNMKDERYPNAVSRVLRSIFHDCRLESFDRITRDGVDYWDARIFVPLKAEYSIGTLWYKDPIRTLRIGDRHTPVPAPTLTQDDPQAKLDEELKNGFHLRLDDSTEGETGLAFDGGSAGNNSDYFETRITEQHGFLTAKQSVSLNEAVAAFNGMAGENAVGRKQPKLTADEVVASIRNWIDRNKGNAATRKELQQIIDTQTLRAGHQLSFTSRYVSEGHVFDVWEIGFGDDASVPWLRIRDVLLASRPKTQQERELWEQIRTEMAESFDRVRLGGLDASSQRSPEEQTRLGKLLDQAYQPPVVIPGTRSAADEAALHKFRPYRATRRAQVEDEIHKMLQQPTLKSIRKLPLAEVAKQFGRFHDVKIVFDPLWLEDETPDLNQPVSADLGDLSLGAALDFILVPLGMSYIVRDDEIRITSIDRAEAYQYERVHELPPPLKGQEEQVIQALTTRITPDKWWVAGGEYVAAATDGRLTISANRDTQMAVVELLEEMRSTYDSLPTSDSADGDRTGLEESLEPIKN
ncbi:MAG: DUF1559 domain-containing protein [Planctomycetaceae bacterium]